MTEDNINLLTAGKASSPDMEPPRSRHEDHEHVAAELVSGGSLEFSHGTPGEIATMTGELPYRMPIFVPGLPNTTLESRFETVAAIHGAGFEPVPHIPARRIDSAGQLQAFLGTLAAEHGVHRALVIGGDPNQPAGPFETSRSLLESGVLQRCGITEVGLAGFPEGHPRVPADRMMRFLAENLEFAAEQGLGGFVVTQFTLVPQRITEWCARFHALSPATPVFAGIPGPATHEKLVHFARYCGVSTALTAVSKVGVNLPQLVDHERSGQQLRWLASYNAAHPASNIIGIHMYGFGGFGETARWIAEHCRRG